MSERHAELIALVEKWLADESGYDERVYRIVKARLEERDTLLAQRDKLLEEAKALVLFVKSINRMPNTVQRVELIIAEVEQADG